MKEKRERTSSTNKDSRTRISKIGFEGEVLLIFNTKSFTKDRIKG